RDVDAALVELLEVKLEGPLEELREPHEGEAHPGRTGELEQPLDDPVDPLQLARHDVAEALAEIRVVDLPVQMAAEGRQRVQRVLDLGGESGGGRAGGGQPIRPSQVVLELPNERDVPEHADDAQVLPLTALERRRAELDRQGRSIPAPERERHAG